MGMIETKSAPTGPEVKTLEDIGAAFEVYHAANVKLAAEVKAVQDHADEIEKKMNRARLGGGGASVNLYGADIESCRKAIAAFVRNGSESELKAMSVGSDPDGGYLVLPAQSATMTKKLFDATPMRRLARVETITTGDAWVEPIDKDDIEAVWVGETEDRPATDTPQAGVLTIPVREIYANPSVTQRLLDDIGFDLGAWVEGKITDRFARSEGSAFIAGNSIKKPRGILTYPVSDAKDASRPWGTLQYVKSGAATGITADALKATSWSLRAPYRQGATWLMNSNTASSIDKLKDGNGQYMWQSSMTAGAPNMLCGFPVEISEDMPDVEAGALPIAFGNWKLGYVIVDKAGIRFLRDPYSDKPNVSFYAYRRVGGGMAHSEAIKLVRVEA